MSGSVSRRAATVAGLFVVASAVLVLFGAIDGESVWEQSVVGRWIVIAASLSSLFALALAVAGRHPIATVWAWIAIGIGLVTAMSVGMFLLPALIVVLVLLMRSVPA